MVACSLRSSFLRSRQTRSRSSASNNYSTARVCLAVSCDHPFARRQSVSLADAAREPFIGLMLEEYPRYQEYLAAIFARVNDKPRIVEEHDGWSGVFSAVSAGTGVAIASDAFSYAFSDRIKLLRLTPEPKRVAIGILTRKGKLSPAAEKFCQCAKEAFGTLGNPKFDPYKEQTKRKKEPRNAEHDRL